MARPSTIAALFKLYQGRLSQAATKLRALRDWALERGEDSDCLLLTLAVADRDLAVSTAAQY